MFVNLTPHAIKLPEITIEPSGTVARCSEFTVPQSIVDGVSIVKKTYGDVTGVPDPVDGTIYIVSMLVRTTLGSRKDLASPGDLVRDDKGNIVGSLNLVVN